MKVKLLFIIIQFLLPSFFSSSNAIAQNLADFLPLQVGNIWVYECSTQGLPCGGCTGRTRVRISGDSVINGKTYYKSELITRIVSGSCNYCGNTAILPFTVVRVDPQSANVFQNMSPGCSYSPGEVMLDSFKARPGDSVRMNCQPPSQWGAYICTDTNNITIFGSGRQGRIFTHNGFEGGFQRKYAKGIGCYFASSSGLEGGTYVCNRRMTLFGCVINGIVYGDTSMLVGIKQISEEIPRDYALCQNYPNPFNPATNIKFDLPKSGFVKLVIYDLLGKEIAHLVNLQLQAGIYNADWDASSYPSGVYYYQLIVGDPSASLGVFYTETKKMVLIK
jgi:hypothetical protein